MKTISRKYRKLVQQQHDRDKKWGISAKHWIFQISAFVLEYDVDSILDYGAGKGVLKDNFRSLVTEYDPGIRGKNKKPTGRFDMVTCIDVLEHVEPDYVDNVLRELWMYTKKVAFITISLVKSKQKLPDGSNVHIMVQDKEWWLNRLKKYFHFTELHGRGKADELVLQATPKNVSKFTPVVLCMLWGSWGGSNAMQYVYKLHNMVNRNTSYPFRFVCLNDRKEGEEDGIHFIKIPEAVLNYPLNLPKFYMHAAPELRGRRVLFFDLDMVITDSIDCYFEYEGYLAGIEPFHPLRKNDYIAGGLLSFEGGTTEWMFDWVRQDPQSWAKKTQGGKERLVLAELEKESDQPFDRWQRMLEPGLLISFKRHVEKGVIPENNNVIAFHGRPRPHELHVNHWIKKDFWR